MFNATRSLTSRVVRRKQQRNIGASITGLPALKKQGGLCMRGQIYAKQKCPKCGGTLKNDENRQGCYCLKHPEQSATKGFVVRFGRDVSKHCSTYDIASRLLTGMRYEVDNNKFDPRDYNAQKLLGFETIAQRYLDRQDPKKPNKRNVERYLKVAMDVWGGRNIKTIGYAEFDELFFLLKEQGLSDKTIYNYRSCYHKFFKWVEDMESEQGGQHFTAPKIPEITYVLETRNIITKEQQALILEQIKKNTYHIEPKIYLGCKLLAVYVAMRPGEMRQLSERHMNVDGYLMLPAKITKEGELKPIPLLDEDIAILKQLPEGSPDDPFFRWSRDYNNIKAGTMFGEKLLYKHWIKACKQLGIEGVDLYGGTKHSTVSALRQDFTYDEIKEYGTRHATNKAFDRYMQGEAAPSRKIYEKAAEGLKLHNKLSKTSNSGKIVKLRFGRRKKDKE